MTHPEGMGAAEGMPRCPLMPTYAAPSVMFVRGEGTRLWDSSGKEYLDFLCGLAVTSLGHAHPRVTEAIASQAGRLLHTSNLFATEHNAPVAQTLDRLLGGGGQVFFANSGAEANEAAIKVARRWAGQGRHTVFTALQSFHGRTLSTLHATGQPEKHEPFQPLPEGFRHVPFGDASALEAALDPSAAAVLVEPVQAEGGVNVAPAGYLGELSEICRDRGLLLMLDEVQTGMARTGRWFAHQHSGVRPDVVTMAKALGNGMPIGACWARAEVAAAFRPGDHGSTFGGQPLATAAARATLEVMEQIDAPGLSESAGERLRSAVEAIPAVLHVRGQGLLLAAEINVNALPEAVSAADVAAGCLRAGLVVNAVTPTALRLTPPITVSGDEIDEAVAILSSCLAL